MKSAPARPVAAIVLAAGKGKRMNSPLPKVVHKVAGLPMVRWVVQAVHKVAASPIIVVVGHGEDEVRTALAREEFAVEFVIQETQQGTAHATLCAEPALDGFTGDVFVLAGDGPLIRSSTLQAILRRHRSTAAAATIATSVIENPEGYGRILRDPDGRFVAIVEHRHATAQERQIHEVYPSYACFDASVLFESLRFLEPNESTGEYYITDVFPLLKDGNHHVEIVDLVPPEDVLSINTPEQLREVDALLRERLNFSGSSHTMENAG